MALISSLSSLSAAPSCSLCASVLSTSTRSRASSLAASARRSSSWSHWSRSARAGGQGRKGAAVHAGVAEVGNACGSSRQGHPPIERCQESAPQCARTALSAPVAEPHPRSHLGSPRPSWRCSSLWPPPRTARAAPLPPAGAPPGVRAALHGPRTLPRAPESGCGESGPRAQLQGCRCREARVVSAGSAAGTLPQGRPPCYRCQAWRSPTRQGRTDGEPDAVAPYLAARNAVAPREPLPRGETHLVVPQCVPQLVLCGLEAGRQPVNLLRQPLLALNERSHLCARVRDEARGRWDRGSVVGQPASEYRRSASGCVHACLDFLPTHAAVSLGAARRPSVLMCAPGATLRRSQAPACAPPTPAARSRSAGEVATVRCAPALLHAHAVCLRGSSTPAGREHLSATAPPRSPLFTLLTPGSPGRACLLLCNVALVAGRLCVHRTLLLLLLPDCVLDGGERLAAPVVCTRCGHAVSPYCSEVPRLHRVSTHAPKSAAMPAVARCTRGALQAQAGRAGHSAPLHCVEAALPLRQQLLLLKMHRLHVRLSLASRV